MATEQHLLNTKQMAQFVADGFLRFDELVPAELNEAACAEMEAGVPRGRAGARSCGRTRPWGGWCGCPRSRV
jgi:hypothetical protein